MAIRVLTRDQLARFLGNNQEAIRYFEQLTAQVSSDADLIVILLRLSQEIAIEANNAIATANNALAELAEISGQLGVVTEAPRLEPVEIPDDLAPPIQVGTLSYQNAESVQVGDLLVTGALTVAGGATGTGVGMVGIDGADGEPGMPITGAQGIQGVAGTAMPGQDGTDGDSQMIPGPQGATGVAIVSPPGNDGQDASNDFVQLGSDPIVDPFIGSYAPGSFDIATGRYAVMSNLLQLTGTQTARVEGTGTLRIT